MMGRTIIQPIGPLYGEAVNGTVFGRPNGSVFVPSSNKIVLKQLSPAIAKLGNYASWGATVVCLLSSGGNPAPYDMIAESQDSSSYMQLSIYSDSDCETLFTYAKKTAGAFNIHSNGTVLFNADVLSSITPEDTYYVRAELYASSGVLVAVSEIKEVIGA